MSLSRPIKCYARQVKRRVGVFKKWKPTIETDETSGDSVLEHSKTKSKCKQKRKKHGRGSNKTKDERRRSVVCKPRGLKRTCFESKMTVNQPSYSSIFNDSLPWNDSPFSKITKNVREDLGLKFVGLDQFNSPSSFTGAKSLSSSSGCLLCSEKSSVERLPIQNESPSPINLSQRAASLVNSAQEENEVVGGKLKGHQSLQDPQLTSPVNSSLLCSYTKDNGKENERLSLDVVEGTPAPPSLLPWVFRRRRQALLITSTPLRNVNKVFSNSPEENSLNSNDEYLKSGLPKDVSNLSIDSNREIGLSTPVSHPEDEVKSCQRKNSSLSQSGSQCDSFLCTSKEAIFSVCKQVMDLNFSSYITSRSPVVLEKIGEGVFSEVFGCLDQKGVRSVWKVQPFEGNLIFNGEEQKKCADVLSEILITSSLSDLRKEKTLVTDCFVEALDFKCVHGPFPKVLLDCWQQYDEKKGSENDCPSIFPESQLMLVTELEYAGIPLEDFVFTSAPQALSVFTQVAYALAVAEMALEFEHRDLHWGNIMIFKTPVQDVNYIIDGEKLTLKTRGVAAKIVDFTLSRATIDGRSHYADLALSPEIFESSGEYQFEIYRLMRKHTKNKWDNFSPYTNVLWLHYLILQMCKAVKYQNKKAKIHMQYLKKMDAISRCILDYSSALHYVSEQDYYPSTL